MCIFCKIVNKEIPADIVFENEQVLAFRDINPQAPVHILVIPKQHVSSWLTVANQQLFGELGLATQAIAQSLGLSEDDGLRVVSNVGPDGGQEVAHLHLHLLAGRHLSWPPG